MNRYFLEVQVRRRTEPLCAFGTPYVEALSDCPARRAAGAARAELLSAELAESRGQKARGLAALERALDAEFRNLPDIIDLKAVRSDYGNLLGQYQTLAESMVTLQIKPPADFLAKVVRTADRWRALDPDSSEACQVAAHILHILNERDLAWDYLTTPIGRRPNEAAPWGNLGWTLNRQGQLDLADRAFAAAVAAEPTDPQHLWDRAQNLRQAGKQVEAQRHLQQLAEGSWQPRFQALQAQARWQMLEK